MSTKTTEAFRLYYESTLKGAHNNPALLARWGADPSRFETQIMCRKMGHPIPDTKMYEEDGEVFGPTRWPYDAASNPNYSDPPIKYLISKRLLAIGSTWWDWKNKRTYGLGFDFDSLVDHDEDHGIPQEEIDKLDRLDCPWMEINRSTRGNGRHIYIWFGEPYPVSMNHSEHAAIARSLLPMLGKATGLDIEANVDCCGQVLWFHHENATKENQGYALVKPATQILTANDVPSNWRDNLEVVSGGRSKVRVQGWTADGLPTQGDELDEMTQAHARVKLEEAHIQILEALECTGHSSLWVSDHHLWQGHTGGLKQVYDEWAEKGKPLKGLFDTNSRESDPGKPNCFMRPKVGGGWDVYRFGEGTSECVMWDKQGKWTHTTYNHPATLKQICFAAGGFEGPNEDQGYIFATVAEVELAIKLLGSSVTVPSHVSDDDGRTFSLRMREDGKVIFTISKVRDDKPSNFPLFAKTAKGWARLLKDAIETPDKETADAELWCELDDKFRCLKADQQFEAWVIQDASEEWVTQPRENVKSVLVSMGFNKPDTIFGGAIMRSWMLVNEPFGPEYPGGRKWNRNSPQFLYEPIELGEGEVPCHPTWDRLMNHCGCDLDNYIHELPWAQAWSIHQGGDYLKAWVACMFRNPYGKLPYLFMYGPQNSGKSSFHDAIRLLITRGVEGADRALTSKGGYNGELNGVVLAVVDEVNIAKSGPEAYDKMKEWTTAVDISIHAKYKQPKSVKNTLHFVQMANSRANLPLSTIDTRITAMNVPSLEEEIPRDEFLTLLKKEAPHFMRTLFDWELQPPAGRLMLPLIETQGKMDAAEVSMNPLEQFVAHECHRVAGSAVTMKDFKAKFYSTLEDYQKSDWSEKEIQKQLSEEFPVGRAKGNVTVVGNISFVECEPTEPYVKREHRLIKVSEE
jgi:hypothetical protein